MMCVCMFGGIPGCFWYIIIFPITLITTSRFCIEYCIYCATHKHRRGPKLHRLDFTNALTMRLSHAAIIAILTFTLSTFSLPTARGLTSGIGTQGLNSPPLYEDFSPSNQLFARKKSSKKSGSTSPISSGGISSAGTSSGIITGSSAGSSGVKDTANNGSGAGKESSSVEKKPTTTPHTTPYKTSHTISHAIPTPKSFSEQSLSHTTTPRATFKQATSSHSTPISFYLGDMKEDIKASAAKIPTTHVTGSSNLVAKTMSSHRETSTAVPKEHPCRSYDGEACEWKPPAASTHSSIMPTGESSSGLENVGNGVANTDSVEPEQAGNGIEISSGNDESRSATNQYEQSSVVSIQNTPSSSAQTPQQPTKQIQTSQYNFPSPAQRTEDPTPQQQTTQYQTPQEQTSYDRGGAQVETPYYSYGATNKQQASSNDGPSIGNLVGDAIASYQNKKISGQNSETTGYDQTRTDTTGTYASIYGDDTTGTGTQNDESQMGTGSGTSVLDSQSTDDASLYGDDTAETGSQSSDPSQYGNNTTGTGTHTDESQMGSGSGTSVLDSKSTDDASLPTISQTMVLREAN
ncbi:hypothetical protein BJ878DRAFT_64788 [Calycina marina]|uniref:Uncharacterized protein n=1 Tax=Calycina marina TaxID=1763456 RepID=A0A9P7Z365_9HELO|nr:hypothetical protein BJ878DRAFT_64788 [Calycina marina]